MEGSCCSACRGLVIKEWAITLVSANDGFPDQICGPCIAKLDETSEFIEKCMKSQKHFEDVVSGEEEIEEMADNFAIKEEPLDGLGSSITAEDLVDTILQKEAAADLEDTNDGSDQSLHSTQEEVALVKEDDTNKETDTETEVEETRLRKEKKTKRPFHKCGSCSKGYSKIRSLKTHQRRVHEKSMEKCPKCTKVLNSNYLWQYHILIHSNERPHSCPQCKKTFKTKHEASKHLKTHIPIEKRYNFSCEICGKRFTNKGNLTMHLKLHSDERPYVCDLCGKSFRHKGSLEDHQLGHKGEKTFICGTCGKGFFRVQALAIHERCHSGMRPFFCNHCGKGFRSAKVLKRHELIHTDARPYPCQYCGKGFRDHGKRKVHERIHTGERPYECTLCPVAFYESGNLKKHLQKVHKQPKSIHIRMRKDGEEKMQYEVPFVSADQEPESQPREEVMEPNPLLGHSIFSNSTAMNFMPTHHPGPYHVL